MSSGRADPETGRRFIGNALSDTDRLDLLVQKVLDATRYGTSEPSLQRRRQPLGDIVERAIAAFEPGARAAGASVTSAIADDVDVLADDEALTIAVSNLLENALKYGGEPVEIEVVVRKARGQAILEVTDNGAGIPEQEVDLVFDRFYRAGDEMTRTSRGTGLGLYLVQRIVMEHDGTAEVAETGRGGTTVRVSIPEVEAGESGP